jgi:2-polyprenyl-6-methoxyphenol hydroxylase-like FAD-dependent oxidoreductase
MGGNVVYGTAFEGLHQDDSGVVVETSDGKEDRFDIVVGADGNRSNTRACLGIEYTGFDLPETWSIADVDAEGWENSEAFTLCTLPGGKVVVVAPLEATRYRVISNTKRAHTSLPLPFNVGNIRREANFTISVRQAVRYNEGAVYLAGDAAHCHSPAGGLGMNLGIADGAELAQRIVSGGLDGYSAARHADGAQIIAQSERIRKLVTTKPPITRAIRNSVFKLINATPALQRRVAQRFLGN